jgi:hypothetical protein
VTHEDVSSLTEPELSQELWLGGPWTMKTFTWRKGVMTPGIETVEDDRFGGRTVLLGSSRPGRYEHVQLGRHDPAIIEDDERVHDAFPVMRSAKEGGKAFYVLQRKPPELRAENPALYLVRIDTGWGGDSAARSGHWKSVLGDPLEIVSGHTMRGGKTWHDGLLALHDGDLVEVYPCSRWESFAIFVLEGCLFAETKEVMWGVIENGGFAKLEPVCVEFDSPTPKARPPRPPPRILPKPQAEKPAEVVLVPAPAAPVVEAEELKAEQFPQGELHELSKPVEEPSAPAKSEDEILAEMYAQEEAARQAEIAAQAKPKRSRKKKAVEKNGAAAEG